MSIFKRARTADARRRGWSHRHLESMSGCGTKDGVNCFDLCHYSIGMKKVGVPMALHATKFGKDAGLPRGGCLQCPKRSAWTLRAVPGPTPATATERILAVTLRALPSQNRTRGLRERPINIDSETICSLDERMAYSAESLEATVDAENTVNALPERNALGASAGRLSKYQAVRLLTSSNTAPCLIGSNRA